MATIFDMQVGARTLAMEARGEPAVGQAAVAHTIKNRWLDGRWGYTIASVCLWNRHVKDGAGQVFQFSGWREEDPNFTYACGLRDDDPMFLHMSQILQAALDSDADPSGGALFYYANSMSVPPVWAPSMRVLGEFGNQKFLTDQPVEGAVA